MMQFEVTPEDVGTRLDVFVVAKLPRLSRTSVQKLCDDNKVLVQGKPAKTGYKLRAQDDVIVSFEMESLDIIPDIELPILYEDDDCIVINKPSGLLTHSKGAFNPEATVATFISSRIRDFEGDRGGIVHRLDRGTSGVIIAAKHPAALTWLQKQFSQRKVKKTYMAVAKGTPKEDKAVIEMPIARNPTKPQTFYTTQNGKYAVTEYEVVESKNGYALVRLQPLTGRTHQLRVHLSKLGHPIVGDTIYGGEPAQRLLLHALSLEITLPSHERKIFTAKLPADFDSIMG